MRHTIDTLPPGSKLLAENQLVGTYAGYAVFRNLYETPSGERISIPTSREFEMQKERTLPNGKLTNYPAQDVIFNRHKL
jgi:hypothetical protein